MATYDFSKQEELFGIAKDILEDYNIQEWSFGGGTALSCLHYEHRMSYDIDIFLEDYSEIQILINAHSQIAKGLGIDIEHVSMSTTGITFIIDTEEGGLKLDFVCSQPLTSKPYTVGEVFCFHNIKVQTPLEIIARKLKFREKATIRDFVDYALVEKTDQLLTKLKSENIVDIDRFFDVIEKFNNFDDTVFNIELEYLMPYDKITKSDLSPTINALMTPDTLIKVAVGYDGTVVAFDEFIEGYGKVYGDLGNYDIYTIENKGITYKDVLELKIEDVLSICI